MIGNHLVHVPEISLSSFLYISSLLAVTYTLCQCFYNLFLHPLRHIPGPKLAGMCSIYDFYYDVLKGGTYLWEIRKMHDKYGPVVRINPNEVHIDDPDFYQSIYTGGMRKVNKDVSTVAGFGVPTSVAATVDHLHHRSRRGYLNPYFSKRSIVSMEPLVHERISALFRRFDEALQNGHAISLDKGFSAMTADIITKRFFGHHYDYISIPDMRCNIRDAFQGVSNIFHVTRFVPWAIKYLKSLPIPVIRLILPSVADLLELQEDIKSTVQNAPGKPEHQEQRSVIVQALEDEKIPASERTLDRLLDEGQVIIFAGTETSSRTLSVGMYYLLSEPSIIETMRAELEHLDDVPDEALTLQHLEPLPFLTGVVKESIRLAFGPLTRLPRVATEDAVEYKDYLIPPGYPISQSTYFVHTNPRIYPDPYNFNPNRWVKAAETNYPLNNYLVSFTKGSRQCLGIGLAHAELYLAFARTVRNYNMTLYNTTLEDVKISRILIVGQPPFDKGKGPGQGEVEVKVVGKARGKCE